MCAHYTLMQTRPPTPLRGAAAYSPLADYPNMAQTATCSVPKPLPLLTGRPGPARTGVAQLAGCHPTKRKAAASIPRQGPGLGCGFGPWSGGLQEAAHQCFSFASVFLSLSFSLPPPSLKINKTLKKKFCPKARECIEAPLENK